MLWPRHLCRLVAVLLSLAVATSSDKDVQTKSANCDASSEDGVCAAGGVRLKWRAKPYNQGDRHRGVWGGEYVSAELGAYFDGPTDDDDWDLLFTQTAQARAVAEARLPLRKGRLVNHCGYFVAAGQKCYYAGHTRRVREVLESNKTRLAKFTYLETYMLKDPKQFGSWKNAARADPHRPWVFKPCTAGMSQGIKLLRGQELLDEVARGPPKDWAVAQEYMQRPFLGFGGKKFHLRVYVLVTRWDMTPNVLVYNEGVVFQSRQAYEHKALSHERDIFSHISHGVEGFPHAVFWDWLDAAPKTLEGVWPNSASVRAHMIAVIREIFSEALEKSFGSPHRLHVRGFGCFDLLGLDVMFDDKLYPYVLEVNTGPNLETDDRGEENSRLLQSIKKPLIKQLSHWASLYVQFEPSNATSAVEIEDRALVNFTRVI